MSLILESEWVPFKRNISSPACSDRTTSMKIEKKVEENKTGGAGDRTRGLSHAKRTLYHWATPPLDPKAAAKKLYRPLPWLLAFLSTINTSGTGDYITASRFLITLSMESGFKKSKFSVFFIMLANWHFRLSFYVTWLEG